MRGGKYSDNFLLAADTIGLPKHLSPETAQWKAAMGIFGKSIFFGGGCYCRYYFPENTIVSQAKNREADL